MHESEDMVKYFTSRLIYFQEPAESEISSSITLTECNKWFIPH